MAGLFERRRRDAQIKETQNSILTDASPWQVQEAYKALRTNIIFSMPGNDCKVIAFTSAFSHDGLIGQLEFEGYSTEDATYGADNCGADWNEQAVKKAGQYLSHTSMSRSGLIGQLEFEGFTHEQAAYGADNA
jgi:hypothetical protein